MRKIGALSDSRQAGIFSAYLSGLGIENTLRPYRDDVEIWVYDEDRLDDARHRLEDFRRDSNDPRYYRAAPPKAPAVHPRSRIGRLSAPGVGPVTLVLLVASIGIYVLAALGLGAPIYSAFLISHYRPVDGGLSLDALQQILVHGQIWRLITPIFLHFNILHIVFNMIWLYQLGNLIETRESSPTFTLQVLSIGIGSNLAQFWLAGPLFGGMSGVIYGLFGYVWLRAKFDPGSGYYMQPFVAVVMLSWLALCFTGLLGPIANGAHLAGLVLGGVWAWATRSRPRR